MRMQISSHRNKRPWLMKLRPLWLREGLFWKLYYRHPSRHHLELFESAPLEFAEVILKLLPSDILHRQIAYMGFCELEASRHIAKLAEEGGLFVDVGANYGYYSCLWAGLKPTNKVIAYEPSSNNLSPLIENIRINEFCERIDVQSIAIGKEPSTLPFTFEAAGQTGWGGLSLTKEPNSVEVQVNTLDNLFPEDTIDVLKIDTEGADTWVLQGAEKLLTERRIRHIFFEQNLVRMATLGIQAGEAQNLLTKLNYHVRYIAGTEYYATIDI